MEPNEQRPNKVMNVYTMNKPRKYETVDQLSIFKSIRRSLKRFNVFKVRKVKASNDNAIRVSMLDRMPSENVEPMELRLCVDTANTVGTVNSVYCQEQSLTSELNNLKQYGWYWGPLSPTKAGEKLNNLPDGTFLIRDSSHDRGFLSLSFRSASKTYHTRIATECGHFGLEREDGVLETEERSVVDLVNSLSQMAIIYTNNTFRGVPVRLTKPLSRFTNVRSLQHLCRFVIRQHVNLNDVSTLPLPCLVKHFLLQDYF